MPSTFGGEVQTDTLTRIRDEGTGFNRLHTTAMCSPTRASLMIGRNHHRIGIRSASRLSGGRSRIEITTAYAEPPPAGPLDYYDRAPFPFTGQIHNVNVRYAS